MQIKKTNVVNFSFPNVILTFLYHFVVVVVVVVFIYVTHLIIVFLVKS